VGLDLVHWANVNPPPKFETCLPLQIPKIQGIIEVEVEEVEAEEEVLNPRLVNSMELRKPWAFFKFQDFSIVKKAFDCNLFVNFLLLLDEKTKPHKIKIPLL
jgi:hypothetical protein